MDTVGIKISDRVYNPYHPVNRRILDEIVGSGIRPTSERIWDRAWEDWQVLMKLLDPLAGAQALERASISHVLKEHGPAYRTDDGWEHIDSETENSVEDLERVSKARHQILADMKASVDAIDHELEAARLRSVTPSEIATSAQEAIGR